MDRISAEADLRKTLGTLRYLKGLAAHHLADAQPKAEAGAQPKPDAVSTAPRPDVEEVRGPVKPRHWLGCMRSRMAV